MPDADTFVLRIRAAFWGETFDAAEALNDVYNGYVRDGKGLSLWRYETEAERESGAAIMVEKRPDPAKGTLQVIEIDGARLREAGFAPAPTPEGADSSHADAPRLHHDILTLNRVSAAELRDLLQTSGTLRNYRRDDLRPVLIREMARFSDEATRARIQESVDRHKPKGP